MRNGLSLVMTAILMSAGVSSRAAEKSGDVSGQFLVDRGLGPAPPLLDGTAPAPRNVVVPDERILVDPRTRGLANVFIYLLRAPAGRPQKPQAAAEPEVVIKIDQMRYQPHTALVRTNQKLRLISHSPEAHAPHPRPIQNTVGVKLLQAPDKIGLAMEMTVAEPVPIEIGDDIHPWMRTWVLVSDHPYAAITDNEGRFSIKGLPAGEHSFRVWHEATGFLEKTWKVTVTAGQQTVLPVYTVAADSLRPKD